MSPKKSAEVGSHRLNPENARWAVVVPPQPKSHVLAMEQ
jgi:hypothetical protein